MGYCSGLGKTKLEALIFWDAQAGKEFIAALLTFEFVGYF